MLLVTRSMLEEHIKLPTLCEEYEVFSVVIVMRVVEMTFNRNQRTMNAADIIQRSHRQSQHVRPRNDFNLFTSGC
jgi:predicted kinase